MSIYRDFTIEELDILEEYGVIEREELEKLEIINPEEYKTFLNNCKKEFEKLYSGRDFSSRNFNGFNNSKYDFEDDDFFNRQDNKRRNEDIYQDDYKQQNKNSASNNSYSNTYQEEKSSGSIIENIKEELEDIGYFPTKQIAIETQLNLSKMNKSKVGQKIHAFCLSGPPGAGKSFYVESYVKLAQKKMNKTIEIISYQCHAKTSESNLYEDINIAAAIKGDSDKVVVSGKLVQAIDLANSGNIAILFLDEYDKAGEEVDTFLLNFLQDGVVDTTQRGKVALKEECMKNLQVFLCKNDARETLSGPLTRRLKFLELDYMTPENLCKIVNKKMSYTDSGLRDAVILIYTAMYETLPEHSENSQNESLFEFSRLPAASECMQAIEDANELMEIGANSADIILDGVVSNIIKNKDDLEQFKLLTKSNNQLIDWYNKLMEALGSENGNYIKDVKKQMAREFFPEEIKRATREIEEEGKRRKEQLEKQYRTQQQELEDKIKSAKEQLKEYDMKLKILYKQEENIKEREEIVNSKSKEVQRLRDNAEKDAKTVADTYLKQRENELNEAYNQKNDELEKFRAETEKLKEETEELRANANKDALENAKIALKSDRERLETELNKKTEKINEQIRGFNLSNIDIAEKSETIKIYEEELLEHKKLLEKLLGRPVKEDDFGIENKEETISSNDKGEFKQINDKSQEIQENSIFNRTGSVFDNSTNGIWINLCEITLEKCLNENTIFNNSFLKNLLEVYEEKGIYKDGFIIYQGTKTTIIAVRSLEKHNEDSNKNKFVFYSNSTVLSRYSLLDVCNFINNLTLGGKYLSDVIEMNGKQKKLNHSTPIETNFNCMIYSEEKLLDTKSDNSTINKIENNQYLFTYENKEHTKFSTIAKEIFDTTKCSRKDVTIQELVKDEQEAFILHSKNIGVDGLIEKIPNNELTL